MQSTSCNVLRKSMRHKHVRELHHRAWKAATRPFIAAPISPMHTSCTQLIYRIPVLSSISRCPPLSAIHTSSSSLRSRPPSHKNRGPVSKETTQTNFEALNVLGGTPTPSTAIDACHSDGFLLNSGKRVSGGDGLLLVGGEAFAWRPWEASQDKTYKKPKLVNDKGQWVVPKTAWGLLDAVWPKPDILILGVGPHMHPVAPEVRAHLNDLGIRLEIQDTRNAAAQFNLLATERGVSNVAAALVPMGWKEGK